MQSAPKYRVPAVTHAIAAFLVKLAKHMALLASFLIIGKATGRAAAGPVAVFALIAGASVVYALGRRLQAKSASLIGLLRDGQ